MGIGVVSESHRVLVSRFCGHGTNNTAEYYSVIAAVDWAIAHLTRAPVAELRIHMDSLLVVNQYRGKWAARKTKRLHACLVARVATFQRVGPGSRAVVLTWVSRKQNRAADAAANAGLALQCIAFGVTG